MERIAKRRPERANGTERPTIREVAKHAGVALMTVSRVINGHPSVKVNTKKKVLAAIRDLGYERNEAAGLLKGQRAMIIGLIVPDLSDSFFAASANIIEGLAREHGYMTLVVSSGGDVDLEMQQAELMARRKLSGLLLVTSGKPHDDTLRKLIHDGLNIVAFDRPLGTFGADAVLVEHRAGAEEATEHLIDHGHQHVAFVGDADDSYPVKERIRGYTTTMMARKRSPHVRMDFESVADARSWLQSIRGQAKAPTALLCANYKTSVLMLRALNEESWRIPAEMAVIGFDEFDLATLLTPPLTTVGHSAVDVARRAFRLLLERVQRPSDAPESSPEKILLPATLNVRESCGKHSRRFPTASLARGGRVLD